MFKFLFALFALFAVAFAAPSPNPEPKPVAAPSPITPVLTYGAAPIAYSSYHVPVAYSSYSHVAAVPTAYTYSAPLIYH